MIREMEQKHETVIAKLEQKNEDLRVGMKEQQSQFLQEQEKRQREMEKQQQIEMMQKQMQQMQEFCYRIYTKLSINSEQ